MDLIVNVCLVKDLSDIHDYDLMDNETYYSFYYSLYLNLNLYKFNLVHIYNLYLPFLLMFVQSKRSNKQKKYDFISFPPLNLRTKMTKTCQCLWDTLKSTTR